MKPKKVIALIAFGVLVIFCNYKYFTQVNMSKSLVATNVRIECGKVLNKTGENSVSKYHIYTDYLLVVEYPSGVETVNVTFGTWSTSDIGETVCFEKSDMINGALMLYMVIQCFVLLFVLVWLVAIFVTWITD